MLATLMFDVKVPVRSAPPALIVVGALTIFYQLMIVTLFAPIRTTTKEIDRYTLEKQQLAKINIKDKKIVKLLDLPREYGTGGLMRVHPDGKTLYLFSRDILIIDVEEFRIVDKILMDRPMFPGLGLFRFGSSFESHDEPNALTFVYNSTDLMTNRGMMGIARFDLRTRDIDFYETTFYPNFGDTEPTQDILFKPLQPFAARLSVTVRF